MLNFRYMGPLSGDVKKVFLELTWELKYKSVDHHHMNDNLSLRYDKNAQGELIKQDKMSTQNYVLMNSNIQ